ncbi:glycosyltransferase family 4 protein [Antrihabitans sp. YC3-6]|uniref:Glycosyltransferase family 4 protein n=1 Tax=Antrihabitans stalagmiti TaxID=2799499 RepID=A0A934NSE4_9NOCA|nr:glycosyltransferase family 4 protein [Antrihabitans stalagmiti]
MLWLSPWMRPLARVYCEALAGAGIEVMLVTSNQHPESDAARPYERVLDPRPKTPNTWRPFGRALAEVRRFAPDVVVTELVRDPRWLAFGRLAPRVQLIHDDRPHDAGEQRPGWERRLFDRWGERAAATVAFSNYVAGAIGGADVVPLTSDLDEALVPAFVDAEGRRDVVLIGRLNSYKNIEVTMAAWRAHVEGPAYRGDDLVLIGGGDTDVDLPPKVRWIKGAYSYADVLPVLSRAKASVVHYRRATQSGVQVLAMQVGVTPIVSTEGALPEFQPPGETPIGVDDVAGLTRAFDQLADPYVASRRGAAAQAHYRQNFAADVSAAALTGALDRAVVSRARSIR